MQKFDYSSIPQSETAVFISEAPFKFKLRPGKPQVALPGFF
jgi:hypothetical protein